MGISAQWVTVVYSMFLSCCSTSSLLIHSLVEIPIRLDSGVFSFFPALFSKFHYCLSNRLAGPADGIVTQTVQKTLPGSLFCLSKTGPCVVISCQISSKCTREVVYYLLYIPPLAFLVSVLSISRIVGLMRRVIVGFWPFDRQVANTVSTLLAPYCAL